MESTKEIPIPKKIIGQVIGQDAAVEIIKKAAHQRRHVLLIGDPGTGKSMLGLALAELLPKEKLVDIVSMPNPNDENTPSIKALEAGKGREEVRNSQLQAKQFFKNQNFLFFLLAILALVAPWWVRYQYKSDLMFTAFFLGGMLFLVGVVFLLNVGPRMLASAKISYPKLIVDNYGHKQAPFYDATGSHAGALLGDVLHDPLQSGGLGTPANLRVVAGLIHKANKGVIFIDEIATLHPRTQQELLSALQEKQFPITGQSEHSSGAMVRTEPVPCLTPNTLIKINGKDIKIGDYVGEKLSKQHGLRINTNQEIIASFTSQDQIISFNKTFQKDIPLLLYKTKYQGELIEIELDNGRVLQITPDHPLITKQGMVKADELKIGDSVVIDADQKQTIISEVDIINTYSEEQRRVAYAYLSYCKLSKNMPKKDITKLLKIDESTIRNWRKGAKPRAIKALERLVSQGLCPLTITDKRLKLLARIAGVLFGDGGLARNRLYFCTGLKAQKDIADFIKDTIRVFGGDIKEKIIVRNTGKGFDVSVNNAYIVRLFAALGVPKNDKVIQPFRVPKWLYRKPALEKEFFSGLISAELYGNIKKISDQPSFVMSKIIKLEKEHLLFLKEIQRYLNKNKIKTSNIKKSKEYDKKIKGKYEKAARYSFNCATSHKDLLNFLKSVDIVYANHKKQAIKKIAERSKEYLKNKKRLEAAYQKINRLRKEKCTIKEIAKKLSLAKNTVLKKVEPTYQRYLPNFKKEILEKVTRGEKVKLIASAQNIPIPTIRYWLKNENK